MNKIVFTGHRPNKLNNDYEFTSPLVRQIKYRIIHLVLENTIKGHVEFIVGMALGTDQLAALIAIELGIPFTASIPFKGQSMIWPQASQIKYGEILMKAEKIFVVSEQRFVTYEEYKWLPFMRVDKWEAAALMDMRNKWMVDQLQPSTDFIIAVWDGSAGGTSNCLKYATSKSPHATILRIDPTLILV